MSPWYVLQEVWLFEMCNREGRVRAVMNVAGECVGWVLVPLETTCLED